MSNDERENVRDNPKSWVAWKDEAERLQVQLAGCLTAAEGAKQSVYAGDYGWSPAYQSVIELRKLYDNAQQSVHPTLGIRAAFQAFVYAVKFSILTAFRRPSQRG